MIIRLKRGTKAQIQNASLQVGEPAFATDTNELAIQGNSAKIFISTNADTVDNFHASQTPTANTIPVADSSNKIADGWLNFVANDPKVKTALNASGSAPIYACRAWVNFDGTTSTPTIRASNNVSSVVKNGTGDYTVNFTTAMPDANYCVLLASRPYAYDNVGQLTLHITAAPATTNVRVIHIGSDYNDTSYAFVAIIK